MIPMPYILLRTIDVILGVGAIVVVAVPVALCEHGAAAVHVAGASCSRDAAQAVQDARRARHVVDTLAEHRQQQLLLRF